MMKELSEVSQTSELSELEADSTPASHGSSLSASIIRYEVSLEIDADQKKQPLALAKQESSDGGLNCPICSQFMHRPVKTNCGHFFCSACINLWFASNRASSCPICRAPVSLRDLKFDEELEAEIIKKVGHSRYAQRHNEELQDRIEYLISRAEQNRDDDDISNDISTTFALAFRVEENLERKRENRIENCKIWFEAVKILRY